MYNKFVNPEEVSIERIKKDLKEKVPAIDLDLSSENTSSFSYFLDKSGLLSMGASL